MEIDARAHLLSKCRQYGAYDPNLWTELLVYLASKTQECTAEIKEVLENVERLNLLPPLIVVKILSRNPAITFGVIKNYLRRKVERKREEMAEVHFGINRLRRVVALLTP
jgi:hypothetical protein